jgi:hypothetical protein
MLDRQPIAPRTNRTGQPTRPVCNALGAGRAVFDGSQPPQPVFKRETLRGRFRPQGGRLFIGELNDCHNTGDPSPFSRVKDNVPVVTSTSCLRAGNLLKGCRLFAFMRTWIVPLTEVIFYKEGDTVPVREWLKSLPSKVARKCPLYLDMLEQQGHELLRPIADFLRDGIYELRPSFQGVNYRILYSFSGRNVVVVSHGIVKESEVAGNGDRSSSPAETVTPIRSQIAQL